MILFKAEYDSDTFYVVAISYGACVDKLLQVLNDEFDEDITEDHIASLSVVQSGCRVLV